jgi:hypothetical protein
MLKENNVSDALSAYVNRCKRDPNEEWCLLGCYAVWLL